MNIENNEHSFRPHPELGEHISFTKEQPIDIHDSLASLIETVAPLEIDLVLEGETGTGKDTLARKIHRLSGCSGRLIAVNCAAIPETLAESELFGVNNGAYTGAVQARAGYIEEANNGILFLDEIDSMPLSLQAKLLRVLENRGIERLGGTRFIPVNMRVIVATQKPLLTLVEQGTFRRDLYFRLNTLSIQLQPLRSQVEIIIPCFVTSLLRRPQRCNARRRKLHRNFVNIYLVTAGREIFVNLKRRLNALRWDYPLTFPERRTARATVEGDTASH